MESSKTRRNPYILGSPVDEKELFFGRDSLLGFIKDNLRNDQQVILLHGQRRIGKSSVLCHIPNLVDLDDFEFVPFDLQDKSNLPLSRVLDSLARDIVDHINLAPHRVALPSVAELENNPDIFSRNFLPEVERALGSKKLVLLIDEFDVLSNTIYDDSFAHFFDYIRKLISEHERLFIIPVVGRKLDDMPKLLNLFKGSPTQEIGFLDELSAKRQIRNPAQGVLEYAQDAIEAILKLSSGHPYITQVICFALFGQARDRDNWRVSREDVDSIVDKAIENAEGGLTWYWEGLPIPEQVIFSAVAEAQKEAISQDRRVIEDPLMHLKEYGVIQTDSLLEEAVRTLIDKNFLDDSGRKIKIELVRRWLVRRYPLRQEIWNLEKLVPEAHSIYEQAVRLDQQGKRSQAQNFYKQILELNPNHFSSLLKVAERSLESKDFPKAVELYERGYKVAPVRTQDNYVLSRLGYGDELWKKKKDLSGAKAAFKQVVKIDPENTKAMEKLRKIEAKETAKQLPENGKRIRLWGSAAFAGIILFGLGYYLGSTDCPAGQKRANIIFCEIVSDQPPFHVPTWEAERFSRGDRPLFPSSSDNKEYTQNRYKGIEAFKNGNYSKAADFFDQAVKANRNDPEVLIYYNNARAREQGYPFTLAAVVPVGKNKDSAKEMLQGVAQAQNNFNNSGGLNGRLLEIVIANDDNEQKKSIEVAEQLVEDKEVLGVIGHHASEASTEALPEYEKAGLAMVSPTSTSTLLRSNVFFRISPSDSVSTEKLAEYAINSLGIEKVVIFYNPESPYSDSIKDAFTENFIQLGSRVVDRIDLTKNLNMGAIVSRSVFEDGAEAALLFPNTAQTSVALDIAKLIAKQIAARNNPERRGLKFLGGATLYSQTTLNKGGEAVEGLILAVPWFREAPESQNFSDAAKTQWEEEEVSWRTATSFDATQAFIKALSPNANRSTVLRKLATVNISSDETSGAPLQFTPQGERESTPVLVEVVRDGSEFDFKLVEE